MDRKLTRLNFPGVLRPMRKPGKEATLGAMWWVEASDWHCKQIVARFWHRVCTSSREHWGKKQECFFKIDSFVINLSPWGELAIGDCSPGVTGKPENLSGTFDCAVGLTLMVLYQSRWRERTEKEQRCSINPNHILVKPGNSFPGWFRLIPFPPARTRASPARGAVSDERDALLVPEPMRLFLRCPVPLPGP
jgi:hypothetical protein